jgi:hypothetical protein
MTESELLSMLLGPVGLLVAMILAIMGVIRGWWVPGFWYREMVADRDEWKEMALRSINAADKAVTLAEPGQR